MDSTSGGGRVARRNHGLPAAPDRTLRGAPLRHTGLQFNFWSNWFRVPSLQRRHAPGSAPSESGPNANRPACGTSGVLIAEVHSAHRFTLTTQAAAFRIGTEPCADVKRLGRAIVCSAGRHATSGTGHGDPVNRGRGVSTQRILVLVAIVLAALLGLLFIADLALGIPFNRVAWLLDIGIVIAAALVIWQGIETFREVK